MIRRKRNDREFLWVDVLTETHRYFFFFNHEKMSTCRVLSYGLELLTMGPDWRVLGNSTVEINIGKAFTYFASVRK